MHAPCTRWLALAICLSAAAVAALTFDQAVKRAMDGDPDDSVLAAFWKEHEEAEKSGDSNRIKDIKIQLGSLLLDMAADADDSASKTAMFKECEKLSKQALEIQPGNIDAEDNLRNAQNQLKTGGGTKKTAAKPTSTPSLFADEDDEDEVKPPVPRAKPGPKIFSDEEDEDEEEDDHVGGGGGGGGAAQSQLTYVEALSKAQQGDHGDAVLAAFRRELATANQEGDTSRRVNIMGNLAALLLDMGNRSPTPDLWNAKYEECIALAEEALTINPGDHNAKMNRDAARRNIALRAGTEPPPTQQQPQQQQQKQQRRSSKSLFEDDDDDDEAPSPKARPAKAQAGKKKRSIFDDDDDEDPEDDDFPSSKPRAAAAPSAASPRSALPVDAEDEDEDAVLLSRTTMTYNEALQLAQSRKVDKTVLAVMRREIEYSRDLSGPAQTANVMTNLAAALLDAANASPVLEDFVRMYNEVIEVSEAALKLDPTSESAKINMRNAKGNKQHRLGGQPEPAQASKTPKKQAAKKGARKGLFDDDEEDEEEAKPVRRGRKGIFDDEEEDDDDTPARTPRPLTYHEALQMAQRRESTPAVLNAFRKEHEEAAAEAAGQITGRLTGIMTNLCALLVDMGNKWPDSNEAMSMYKESEQLALELLRISPGDVTAKTNLESARKNLRIQDPRLTAEPGPEGPFTLTRAVCEGLEVPPELLGQRATAMWQSHFSGEASAPADKVQEALSWELAECGPRVHRLVQDGDFVSRLADDDKDGKITPSELEGFFSRPQNSLQATVREELSRPAAATLMLVMVVKNERAHLERSLPKWAPLVDYWIVGVDDKNTDGSEELIQSTLGHLPGEMMTVQFDGMGPTLTQLIQRGLEKYPNATHGILADADFTPISTPADWSKHELDLMTSKHSFTIWNEKNKEWRRMDWIYRNIPGVKVIRRTHQTLEVPAIPGQLRYTKEITFQVREYTGGYQDRSGTKQDTYIRWLEKDLEEMPGDGRTVYYLAVANLLKFMSGHDPHWQVRENGPTLKNALEALKLFRECSQMSSSSSEQRYFALTEAAQLCERYLNRFKEAEEDYLKAAEMDPVRADAWHGVGELHRKQGQYGKAVHYLRKAAALVMPRRNFGQNEYLYICTRHLSLAKAVQKHKKATAADIYDAKQSLVIALAKCNPDQQGEVEELIQQINAKDGSQTRSEL